MIQTLSSDGDISIPDTFPDEFFQEYIYYYISGSPDTLTRKDADGTTAIDLTQGYLPVASLEGIATFTNLETLEAAGQDLVDVDLTGNKKLVEVDLSDNESLATVDASGLPELTKLSLKGTRVKSLDVSGDAKLKDLVLGNSSLAYLDLTGTQVSAVDTDGAAFVGTASIEVEGGKASLVQVFPGMDMDKVDDVQGAEFNASTGELSGLKAGTPVTYTYRMSDSATGRFQLMPVQAGVTSYEVTFDVNGGVGAPVSQMVAANGKAEEPEGVSRKGYRLRGWTAPGSSDLWDFANDTVNGALKLTASWEPIEYTVAFDVAGAPIQLDSLNLTYDLADSLPARSSMEWEGHRFLGWALSEGGEVEYGPSDRVKNLTEQDGAVVTLHAIWEEIVPETGIAVDEAHFPDPVLRAWVRQYAADGDILNAEEVKKNTSITLNGVYGEFGDVIRDLSGIEYFTDLTYLNVQHNDIDEIDLSKLGKLQELWLDNNKKLGSLDLSHLPDLEVLSADDCGLSEIDLSHNPKLDKIYCMHNALETIDLSHNPALRLAHLSDNRFTSLDFSANHELESLNVHTNQLEKINLDGCDKLDTLFLHGNNFKTIDVSNLPELSWLEAQDNDLESLDVTANPKISVVKAWGNPLRYVNLPDTVDRGGYDKDDEDSVGALYSYETVAANGVLSLSEMGEGDMDPVRVSDVTGAVFDSEKGEFRFDTAAGETTELTYSYAANDDVKLRFSAQVTNKNRYEVSFDAAGASDTPQAALVFEGDKVQRPADPSMTGYHLTGWYADGSDTPWDFDNDVVSGPLTLKARWEANAYTVRFHANAADASGSMADVPMEYDSAKTLPGNAFTRNGYTFAGWATSKDGDVAYKDGAEVENLTAQDGAVVDLYAVWKADAPAAGGQTGTEQGSDNDSKQDPENDTKRGGEKKGDAALPQTGDEAGTLALGVFAAGAVSALAGCTLALKRKAD